MNECGFHSKDDPRFEAAKALFMAADIFAHALVATVDQDAILANRIMKTVQIMVADTIPDCLYEEALVEAICETYPAEDRQRIVDVTMDVIRNSRHEPDAVAREQVLKFLRRLRDGE